MIKPLTIYDSSGSIVDQNIVNSRTSTIIDLSIFISCFNERVSVIETAEANLAAANKAGLSLQLIFVDDASSDGSSEHILEWMKQNSERADMLLVIRDVNAGLGANFRLATTLASGRSFRLSCGDNPEPPEALSKIYAKIVPGKILLPYHVTVDGKSSRRRFVSSAYTKVVNMIISRNVKYYNGQPVFPRLMLLEFLPTSSGFGFQAETVGKILMRGGSFDDVAIDTIQRGESTSIAFRNVLSVLHVFCMLFALRMSRSYHKFRKKRSQLKLAS